MKKTTKIDLFILLVILICVSSLSAEVDKLIKLENDYYRIALDQKNGSIVGIYDKSSKIELIADARLAESFRICLPIPATLTDPGTQANYIIGKQQKLTSAERSPDGVTLAWNGPLMNEQGKPYDVSAVMEIKFVGSGIEFKVNVSNRTDLKLMEVWYPIIGGIRGLGERKQTLTHIPWNAGDYNPEIFWNTRLSYGLGIGVPEHLLPCPGGMPESWMGIYNKNLNRTMYFGLHDNTDRQKVFRIEMQPGIGVLRQGDSWPRPDEIDKDTPLGMILCWIYYLPPEKTEVGQKFEGAPLHLQFDNGDWQASAAIYREWQASCLPAKAMPVDTRVLESQYARVEVDSGNGAIVRVLDKKGGIDLTVPPALADNFRLIVDHPEGKSDVIMGKDQKVSQVVLNADKMELRWNGPLKAVNGKLYSVDVQMQIELSGDSVAFDLSLTNKSENRIAEVWYPLVGGLSRLHEASMTFSTAALSVKKIDPNFTEFAAGYPGQMVMSFTNIYDTNARRGLYFASHDTVDRYKIYHIFRQKASGSENVFVNIHHYPYTRPSENFDGSTVVLRFHNGDWQSAGKFYREWFAKTFGVKDPSQSWIRGESFFQDTMFMLPEGNINYTFKDIPRWAKDAHEYGVNSVMISGWQFGGHDNGYPHYEPDPRLGTWDDLAAAIRKCHKIGVKVYFFVNYQPIMIGPQRPPSVEKNYREDYSIQYFSESEWYENELKNYLEFNRDGKPCRIDGWGMGTLWSRMGHPKLMAWADPGISEYSKILLPQFKKLVEIGADGLHVDKMFPGGMNFNPRCTLSPDASTWTGAMQLTESIYSECKKINPDFAISFECNWDRVLSYGPAVWWVGNMSAAKTIFPEMVETLAITAPYDYLGVNNAVRNGHAVLLGPLNYSRSMGWEPWKGLSRYIREVKRIRDKLSETVFLGESLGHAAIVLEAKPESGVEYNVFRNLKTGKRVCIFTNSGMDDKKQIVSGFESNAKDIVRIYTPFEKYKNIKLPAEIDIPAERIVFVEEL